MVKPIIVVKDGYELRPTLRINRESGFCGGPQWQRAFGIASKRFGGGIVFAGAECVAVAELAVVVEHYMNYLKAAGWKLKP